MRARIGFIAATALTMAFGCSSSDSGGVPGASGLIDQDVTVTQDTGDEPDVQDTPDEGQPPEDTYVEPTSGVLSFVTVTGSNGQTCVTSCALSLNAGDSTSLEVRYTDMTGSPLEGVQIQFDTGATGQVKLGAKTGFTGEDGIARVDLQALADAASGIADVTVDVPGDADAARLTFKVEVVGEVAAPLRVALNYTGKSNVTGVQLKLYLVEGGVPLCSDVHPDGPNAQTPVLSIDNANLASDSLISVLPGLEEAGTQTWLVQALAPDALSPIANGCTSVEVTYDTTTDTTVTIADLPLKYTGDYTVTTQMDLNVGDTVGGTTGLIISLLLNLFDDPGSVAIEAACKGASGTLATVCGFLVGSDGKPAGAGETLAEAATDLFFELLIDNLGAGVVLNGTSIADLLESVSFKSTLRLFAEPSVADAQGAAFAVNMVTHEWTTMTYSWKFTANCPPGDDDNKCGNETVKLSDIYGANPTSALTAGVTANDEFWTPVTEIPNFGYGKILNFLVEKRILPLLFGDGNKVASCGQLPAVDSYSKLISMIFGDECCLINNDCCQIFTDSMVDYFDPTDTTTLLLITSTAPAACQLFIPAADNYIRSEVNKLAGNLMLGTPDGQPCAASDITGNRQVDFLGTDQEPCTWDASFDLAGSPYTPENTFVGDRN